MRSVKSYVSQQMLKVIYYFYFHSIMSYGLIFWGHSEGGMRVVRLQKRIIRIMTGCRSRDSCRDLFIDLKILPQSSLCIYHLILFVNKTMNYTPQIMKYMTIVLDNAEIFTNQPPVWLSIRMECYIGV
jgi:hypothetical protein